MQHNPSTMYLNSLQDDLRPEKLLPIKNTFTVVLFSLPFQIAKETRPKLSIRNIKWTLVTKQEHSFGNDITKEIYWLYSKKFNITKSLRIICIDALGSKGELSGENANSILKYLKLNLENCMRNQNKSPFDVIILPKFYLYTGEDVREIMESLWYLREHVVLISNSSLHATLPSTEVIAVGAATELQKDGRSVLDFLVTNSMTGTTSKGTPSDEDPLLTAWADQNRIRPLGAAVVCAIALGILDRQQDTGNMFHFKIFLPSKA